jgi:chromosomal replication initiation ATPase DnaA
MEQVFKGINTTIFAYGVTGSGKTHTMQGSGKGKEQGVIPRVVKVTIHLPAKRA